MKIKTLTLKDLLIWCHINYEGVEEAFTKIEPEKRKINREIYQELCKRYKILEVGKSAVGIEPFSVPTATQLYNNDFVYARRDGYLTGEYKIYKCPDELTLDEIALICDGGNLCFGYAKDNATRSYLKVFED